ncbi:hypothetical protein Tco_0090064 [Tanacetum coccineum]
MEVIPDKEEVAIDVVPLATKSLSIIDWKIHKEGKKNYYQIVRADGKSQMYRVFSQMLKSFTREDLEDLYKQVQGQKVFTSNDWCSETWVRETCLATLLQLLNKVWFSGSDGSVGVALGLVFSGFSGFSSH